MSKKILVADDDPGILDALQITLEEEGYSVQTTENGNELLTIDSDFPSLILLDIWLSGLDGREVCQKLKAQAHTQKIPVILISANNESGETAFQAGADDFLAKPFSIEELLAKVHYQLNKSLVLPSN